jgi:hypothetical protein
MSTYTLTLIAFFPTPSLLIPTHAEKVGKNQLFITINSKKIPTKSDIVLVIFDIKRKWLFCIFTMYSNKKLIFSYFFSTCICVSLSVIYISMLTIYYHILLFSTLFFTFFTYPLLPPQSSKYNTDYYARILTLVQLISPSLLFFS